ncbi:MAG: flagellar protein FlgN [Candidatus Zixiibacteriota bacterium]|nr:MAG: flagellar protein FlgN [candidate division Zixibacteria bacterium]
MINYLIDVISREAALFESFLALLQEQKGMLVDNDVNGLNECTEKQHAMVVESRRLNQERESLVRKISEANRIEGDLTVSRLLEFADQGQSDRLKQLRELILELNEQITQVRNTNVMLLNQSRESIARTMAMLSRISTPEPAYDRGGAAPTAGSSIAVDRRI